jgi:hypothetical protein
MIVMLLRIDLYAAGQSETENWKSDFSDQGWSNIGQIMIRTDFKSVETSVKLSGITRHLSLIAKGIIEKADGNHLVHAILDTDAIQTV